MKERGPKTALAFLPFLLAATPLLAQDTVSVRLVGKRQGLAQLEAVSYWPQGTEVPVVKSRPHRNNPNLSDVVIRAWVRSPLICREYTGRIPAHWTDGSSALIRWPGGAVFRGSTRLVCDAELVAEAPRGSVLKFAGVALTMVPAPKGFVAGGEKEILKLGVVPEQTRIIRLLRPGSQVIYPRLEAPQIPEHVEPLTRGEAGSAITTSLLARLTHRRNGKVALREYVVLSAGSSQYVSQEHSSKVDLEGWTSVRLAPNNAALPILLSRQVRVGVPKKWLSWESGMQRLVVPAGEPDRFFQGQVKVTVAPENADLQASLSRYPGRFVALEAAVLRPNLTPKEMGLSTFSAQLDAAGKVTLLLANGEVERQIYPEEEGSSERESASLPAASIPPGHGLKGALAGLGGGTGGKGRPASKPEARTIRLLEVPREIMKNLNGSKSKIRVISRDSEGRPIGSPLTASPMLTRSSLATFYTPPVGAVTGLVRIELEVKVEGSEPVEHVVERQVDWRKAPTLVEFSWN